MITSAACDRPNLTRSEISTSNAALLPGDSVCVSIDGDLSLDFYVSAMRKLEGLGLAPYVFRGVPAPQGQTVTNTYIEARTVLDRSRVLIVVAGSASAERNFGTAELPRAVREGRIGFLYRVGTPVGPDPNISGITARTVATAEDFEVALEDDVRALLTPR